VNESKKIGLCCIVKNEEKVIARLIDSVKALVDFVLIVDTGSCDNTKSVATKKLTELNIEYEFAHEPWKNFSHNRNVALHKLRRYSNIDYCFVMDADEVISLDSGFDVEDFKKSLTDDLYRVETLFADTLYYRQLIFKNHKGFFYKGVLHEYLACQEPYSIEKTSGIKVVVNTDGHRSEDENKYEKDAILLEKALAEENDSEMISRYTFYLAQSYRDSGNPEKAIEYYEKRVKLGFFSQEIFESLYSITRMKAKLNSPIEKVIEAGLKAYDFDGSRIEPIHESVKYCRVKEQFRLGYLIAKSHFDFEEPREALFKIHWIYDWGFLDEAAVCAYYAGHEEEAIKIWERVLRENKNVPIGDTNRIKKNIRFAQGNT